MRRYPHYYWTRKGAYFPARIAVLTCGGNPTGMRNGNPARAEELSGWTLRAVELRSGVPHNKMLAHGQCVSSLWSALARFLSSRETTWLFLGPSGRILPLIDFWRGLDDKDIELVGKDWRNTEDRIGTGEDKRSGLCVLEEPPTLILCRLKGLPGKLLILDIRNYGIEIDPRDTDYEQQSAYWMYGLCDCLSTLRAHGRLSLRGTAAAQAVSALRTHDACVRLHCHIHRGAGRLERFAYFGGRCEAFRLGYMPGPVYHLDVRSMYPSICLDLPIPVSLRRYHDDGQCDPAYCVPRAANMCAHVRVKTALPALPFRRVGGVIFPVGEYNTYLAGPELRYACEHGLVTRWYSCAEYTCAPLLRDFYTWWLDRQEAARACGRTFELQWIKRLCNSLPGKFGEPGRRWIPAPAQPEMGPNKSWHGSGPGGAPCRYRNIGWHTQREEVNGESYHSIPSISAFVTSAARARLWDYLEAAGRDTVWYTDTDSLICGQASYDKLLSLGLVREGEIGRLRLVGSHRRCVIHGIRHYQLDDTVTCAGVPKGDIRPGETRGEYFWRQRAADEIALGRRPGGVELPIKEPSPAEYRHGRVLPDGRVEPWVIDET